MCCMFGFPLSKKVTPFLHHGRSIRIFYFILFLLYYIVLLILNVLIYPGQIKEEKKNVVRYAQLVVIKFNVMFINLSLTVIKFKLHNFGKKKN